MVLLPLLPLLRRQGQQLLAQGHVVEPPGVHRETNEQGQEQHAYASNEGFALYTATKQYEQASTGGRDMALMSMTLSFDRDPASAGEDFVGYLRHFTVGRKKEKLNRDVRMRKRLANAQFRRKGARKALRKRK